MSLTLPDRPDAAGRAEIARLAHLLAFVVIANRRHTDLYEWGQRSRPLSLSAEIQHRLLPGPDLQAGSPTPGWLARCRHRRDTFDFSLARDVLHLSLTTRCRGGRPDRDAHVGSPERPKRGRVTAGAGRLDEPGAGRSRRLQRARTSSPA